MQGKYFWLDKRVIGVVTSLLLMVHLMPSPAFAHSLFLGNIDADIVGNTISTVFTMPEDRSLDDADLFQQYSAEAFAITNNGELCSTNVLDFATGNIGEGIPTKITLSTVCENEINELSIHSEYFLEEGYAFTTTFKKGDVIHSAIFNDTTQDVTFTFVTTPETVQGTFISGLKAAGQFIWLGMRHIYTGYDHILFIIALMLGISRFWTLFKIITAFTIAHSVTLILSSLNIVNLVPGIVEPLIALTIAYVAFEKYIFVGLRHFFKQIANDVTSHRWKVAFGFGLLHGLGFASVLKEIQIPQNLFPVSLISFNVGVEVGQFTIIAIIFPVLYWIFKRTWHRRFVTGASILVGLIGITWFIGRVFFNFA